MKLNISKIYKKNIIDKFGLDYGPKIRKIFNSKELEMWNFTLELIKDGYPQNIYDDVNDFGKLLHYLEIYLEEEKTVKFTLEEWFKYLDSMK